MTNNLHSTLNLNVKKTLRFITFISLSLISLLATTRTTLADTVSITADMSPEIIAEYEQQLASESWPEMHTKLALMDNPYAKSYKVLKKKLKSEAAPGERKRLMTHEESIFMAKKMRFDYCQASVSFFVDFAQRAFDLSTAEQKPLSKDQLMTGNGVAYPFTEAEKNNPATRPPQIALTLGWKYKGQGHARAEEFLATCLAIPVELYYKEDK
ncbi:hypothetical protein [Colwellia echini]|uniref:Uncharacterized protein n=1 Tax=Colwellia echini TaxID=1982103 RepID=A0ABY3MTW8_9GAMM|nr:hypothetical protein [Colwellia echini]TYK64651.1 hypothetical protein CWS31_014455 [Colwellia echini]